MASRAAVVVAAVMAGAGWAALAGWLKTKFSANEVITTLMLNYIAHYLLLYLINGPMQDPYSDLPQTDVIPDGMRLAKIIGPIFRLLRFLRTAALTASH